MSVTPPVAHVEMWPYMRMASLRFESQSVTASRIETSSATRGEAVGANVAVGAGVVGAGVGAQPPATCVTPQDVDSHGVSLNALVRLTPSPT